MREACSSTEDRASETAYPVTTTPLIHKVYPLIPIHLLVRLILLEYFLYLVIQSSSYQSLSTTHQPTTSQSLSSTSHHQAPQIKPTLSLTLTPSGPLANSTLLSQSHLSDSTSSLNSIKSTQSAREFSTGYSNPRFSSHSSLFKPRPHSGTSSGSRGNIKVTDSLERYKSLKSKDHHPPSSSKSSISSTMGGSSSLRGSSYRYPLKTHGSSWLSTKTSDGASRLKERGNNGAGVSVERENGSPSFNGGHSSWSSEGGTSRTSPYTSPNMELERANAKIRQLQKEVGMFDVGLNLLSSLFLFLFLCRWHC